MFLPTEMIGGCDQPNIRLNTKIAFEPQHADVRFRFSSRKPVDSCKQPERIATGFSRQFNGNVRVGDISRVYYLKAGAEIVDTFQKKGALFRKEDREAFVCPHHRSVGLGGDTR